MDAVLTKIAAEILDIETLKTRNSDGADFHDIAVWKLKQALEAAYREGQRTTEAH